MGQPGPDHTGPDHTGPEGARQVVAEPVTAVSRRRVRWALLTQGWLDVVFLHWPVDPEMAGRLLPPGATLDLFDGVSYAGLIALRMDRVGWLGLPGLPYLASFPEVNVRLYSVGADGRRGVVFASLDAARLLPVLTGRMAFRLPYQWALMRVCRHGSEITYSSRRRWPGPRAQLRLRIRVGKPLTSPSPLEMFLTARWGLHAAWYAGRGYYLPNEHPRWPLYSATLVSVNEDLLHAAGLAPVTAAPISVLYSPGVPVRAGPASDRPGLARPSDRPSDRG